MLCVWKGLSATLNLMGAKDCVNFGASCLLGHYLAFNQFQDGFVITIASMLDT